MGIENNENSPQFGRMWWSTERYSLLDPKVVTKVVGMSRELNKVDEKKEICNKRDSKMRIALVIPYHPLDEVGGLEIGTRKVAYSISKEGHEVEIITRGKYPHKNLEGVGLTPEGINIIGVGSGIEDIGPYLIDNYQKYDIVQWMEVFPPIPENSDVYNDKAQQQYTAGVILRHLGLKVFLYIATSGNLTNRGSDNSNCRISKEEQILNKLIVGANNGFNFANPQIAAEYTKVGLNISPDRMQFIPFGVDTGQFHPLNGNERREARGVFCLPQDKFIFLYAGRFVTRKKADLLLSAWKSFPPNMKDKCHLVLAGGAAAIGQSDSIYDQVVSQIHEDSVTNIDLVKHEQMPLLMGSCDAFVFPSEREGWPLVVCEAMSTGLPVASTNIDGIRNIVSYDTGVLFEPNKEGQLINAMKKLYQSGDGELMGRKARETVEANWSWNKIAQTYIKFYKRF